jgi:CCR4-NOT complex subunit CAF16
MTVEEKKIEQEPDAVEAARATKPLLSVKNLNFSYDPKATKKDIVGLDCLVQPNSKVILIGANGAGKSTLLRILTGMLWGADVEYDEFDVNGREKVNDQVNGIAYLGERWKRRRTGFEGVCPYTLDTAPTEMFVKWQKDHSARRDELVEVLGVNLDWRLNECSDGQRKKVRLLFKLLKPFKLAIIDEFAADLDIFSRQRFFAYLTKECAERGASVIFATHIFDQVDLWATHVTFMQLDGTLSPIHPLHTLPAYQEILARSGSERAMCPMYTLIVEEMERQYKQENVILADVEQTPTAPTLENGNDEVDAMVVDENAKPPLNPIVVKNLSFSYIKDKPTITGLNLTVPPNSKVLLVGANGSGKSTLIRMLTGQIWTGMEYDDFKINGKAQPNDQHNGVTYLGSSWKRQQTAFEGMCPYSIDCAASEMFVNWQAQYSERRDELVKVLGIDLKWRMNECSDGQRKKVRIMIKLLKPFQVCLIDEFAADLDILSRSHFFDYLSRECKERGASVVYATHIFDQADSWASHVAFMQLDRVLSPLYDLHSHQGYQDVLARQGHSRAMCPMYVLVMEELERQYRASGLFVEDYDNNSEKGQGFVDAIMSEQAKELADERHDTARTKNQDNWVSGRLTRQLQKSEQEVLRAKRMADSIE